MTKLNVFAASANTGEFAYGKVCQDCTHLLGNGESSREESQEVQANIEKACATYDFTLGHFHDEKWGYQCFHFGKECEDDCDCARTEFDSFNNCDMCKETSDGYRHDVIMVKRDLLDTNMTQEQFDKLSDLCNRYGVDMTITDYLVYQPNSSMMAGWAEGWVGGANHDASHDSYKKQGSGKSTIYVGVDPEGRSHS